MTDTKVKKFEFGFKDGAIEFGADPNQDGQKFLVGKIYLSEAFQEAFKKGEKVEGAKLVDFQFDKNKLVIKVDTDKDGEPIADLLFDLAESVDEVISAIG